MAFYPKPVQKLFEAFENEGQELYLVGGAVRDHELGTPLKELDDLDFCTSARVEDSLEILKKYDFTYYKLGMEFGTVGAVLHGDDLEGVYPKDCQITTYRSEEYYRRGSRHPDVRFGETIEQDLSRRDFSINSMALDGSGNRVDPYDGKNDLERKVLRVIGDPEETLAEDPLRILRTARFMSKLGFDPTSKLRDASYKQADHILEISHERWHQEMTKLLKGNHPKKSLKFLHKTRLLGIILPEIEALTRIPDEKPNLWSKTVQTLERIPRDGALGWAALCSNIGKLWTRREHRDGTTDFRRHATHSQMLFRHIADRFKFDNKTRNCVNHLLRNQDILPSKAPEELNESDARKFVDRADPYLKKTIQFIRAKPAPRDLSSTKRDKILNSLKSVRSRLQEKGQLKPHLPSGFGDSIMERLDLEPSPMIGEIKDWLRMQMIEGKIEIGLDEKQYLDYLEHNPPDFLNKN